MNKKSNLFTTLLFLFSSHVCMSNDFNSSKSIVLADQSKIGQRVCKDGTMDYVYQPMACTNGRCVYANMQLSNSVDDAQINGWIEGESPNGEKIKIRLEGWYSPKFNLKREKVNIIQAPIFNRTTEFVVGKVIWDSFDNWYTCGQ